MNRKPVFGPFEPRIRGSLQFEEVKRPISQVRCIATAFGVRTLHIKLLSAR